MKSTWRQKWAPSSSRIMVLLLGLLGFDLLFLTYLNRRPLCIESELLESIHWTKADSTSATIYACSVRQNSSNNLIFIERMDEIQRRVSQLEGTLKGSFLPQRSLHLKIFEGNSKIAKFSGDELILSSDLMLGSEYYLERLYLKAWIFQNQKGAGLSLLHQEILAQFLLWNVGIQKKLNEPWQVVSERWPQLATSWAGYCQSPVRDEIYASICMNSGLSKKAEGLTPFSINFWIAQKLWGTFQEIPVVDQIEVLKKIPQIVEGLSKTETPALQEMNLLELESFVRADVSLWSTVLENLNLNRWAELLREQVTKELDIFKDSLEQVDLFIKKDQPWVSSELQKLQELSLGEVNYRVMAENTEGIWSFPWLVPIKTNSYGSIKAQNLIWMSCPWPTVAEMLALENRATKVILVQNCNDPSSSLIYSGLLHRGLKFFSLDNADIQFVMVNLGALRYIVEKDPTLLNRKLIARVQSKGIANRLATVTHWASALWNQQYRAYEVHATVDVIEWFKLPENTWPDID